VRSRSIAAVILLVVAVAGCSSKPIASRGAGQTPIDETIAPQITAPSGVELLISPEHVTSGAVRVRTRLTGSARAWTAAHVWLDRETSRGWETVWLLDADGHSLSVDEFRRGGTPLNTLGIRVPGTLSLTLSPPPPRGRYRLRLGAFAGAPQSETGSAPAWATGTIEIG